MLLRCYRDGIDPKHLGGLAHHRRHRRARRRRPARRARSPRRPDHHGRRERVARPRREGAGRAVAGVADVAVAARDDDEWGQRVVAFVVPSADGPPTLDALRDAVKDALAAHAAPASSCSSTRVPRTALGKVRRGALPAASVASGPMAGRIAGQGRSHHRWRVGHRPRHRRGASSQRAPSVVLGDVNEATLAVGGRSELGDPATSLRHRRDGRGRRRRAVRARSSSTTGGSTSASTRPASAPTRLVVDQDTDDVGHRDGGQPARRDAVDEARGASDDRGRKRRLDHQHRARSTRSSPRRAWASTAPRRRPSTCTRAARQWSSARTASG